MKILTSATPTKKYLKVGLVAEPKYGKTRLATSLPREPFGDKWAYVAWDPGSEELESVLMEYRDNIVKVVPSAKTIGTKSVFDPHKEAITIATKPWAEG
jgi:hypothetical protein